MPALQSAMARARALSAIDGGPAEASDCLRGRSERSAPTPTDAWSVASLIVSSGDSDRIKRSSGAALHGRLLLAESTSVRPAAEDPADSGWRLHAIGRHAAFRAMPSLVASVQAAGSVEREAD
jgi:hypothetical protein